jgi:pyruvate dehydrogenase E2 component (dihydrolipoamide acetyltransferase)
VTLLSGTVDAKASRAASELAQRLGVSLQDIPSRGWITSADVLAATARGSSATAARVTPTATADAPVSAKSRAEAPKVAFRSQSTSLLKRREARILANANSNGTTSLIGTEINLSGARLVSPPYLFQDSISDLVVFEAARLLKRYPDLNASYLDERTTGHFSEVNFGISFDAGHSLKVLALKGADTLSLGEVQAGFERLLQLYESGAPIAEELLTCSTVTLSDLSRTGATFMLPLLNANQSLIIGITRPAGNRFGLHASFDHRVSEGLSVARFLDELRTRVVSHYRAGAAEVTRDLRCSVCDQTLDAEIKAGVRGLLRIARADGSDGYLCRNCFEGW